MDQVFSGEALITALRRIRTGTAVVVRLPLTSARWSKFGIEELPDVPVLKATCALVSQSTFCRKRSDGRPHQTQRPEARPAVVPAETRRSVARTEKSA